MSLPDADAAAAWVHRSLPLKNTLIVADAQMLEAKFKALLAGLALTDVEADEPAPSVVAATINEAAGITAGAAPDGATNQAAERQPEAAVFPTEPIPPPSRRRPTAKTIRLRDKEHCKFVARQPCLACGRSPSEAHHIRFAQPRALGRKVSDEYTVPVCRAHHSELHRYGDEVSWWSGIGVDPVEVALRLWRSSHPGAFVSDGDAPPIASVLSAGLLQAASRS